MARSLELPPSFFQVALEERLLLQALRRCLGEEATLPSHPRSPCRLGMTLSPSRGSGSRPHLGRCSWTVWRACPRSWEQRTVNNCRRQWDACTLGWPRLRSLPGIPSTKVQATSGRRFEPRCRPCPLNRTLARMHLGHPSRSGSMGKEVSWE